MEEAKARVKALFGGEEAGVEAPATEADQHHVQVKAKALVEKAEKLLEKASDEDKEDMIDLIEQIKDAVAGKDFQAAEGASDRLADILYYLES
jgi:hypothetical protein